MPSLFLFLLWHWASYSCSKEVTNHTLYSSTWGVQLQSSATDNDAYFIANALGLKYEKILPNNYYMLTDGSKRLSNVPSEYITQAIKSFPTVIWVEQQVAEHLESRTMFSDPLFKSQNHLKSSAAGYKISQHVAEVWAKGFTGKNVTVAVIDDGVRGTHNDLKKNYDPDVSVVIASSSSPTSGHGTKCAGVIAAVANNTACGVGVAYNCKIGGIKLFADKTATDAEYAQAFYRDHINPSKIDVFSNSWGPSDNGYTFGGQGHLAKEAIKLGIQKGRHGLGSIYVFSCGNGAHVEDSCAFDDFVNSIYTIPVASITKDGKVTGFSEPCGAIMTAVYSTDMTTTSDRSDSECVQDFGRTSAAAAFLSGILALALEANRNITWRDMQHLIARSSGWTNVDPAVKRVTNAKKFTVNENFGFGVLNASALVDNTLNWNVSVPDQLMCSMNVTAELGIQIIPKRISISIDKNNLKCQSKLIKSLEHVQLRVDLEYTNRAHLVIDVQSTSGTTSRFVYPRKFDSIGNPKSYKDLVVTSVHFWGEPLVGKWLVDIKEGSGMHKINGTGTLLNMGLVFSGTAEVLKDNETENIEENNTTTDSKLPKIIGGSVGGAIFVSGCGFVAHKLKRRRSGRCTEHRESQHNEQELSKTKNVHENKVIV